MSTGPGERLIGAFDPGSGRRRLTAADQASSRSTASRSRPALGALAARAHGQPGRKPTRSPAARSSRPRTSRRASTLDDPDRVSWAEPGALAWAPVDVSGILRESLWESGPTAILVSATLEPRFVRSRLGLDDARELVLPSPFDYREQALLYVPERLPEPRAPGYYARLADEVVALCRLSAGQRPRPHLLLPRTRRAGRRAAPRGFSFPSSCRATRRGNGCSSASGTTSTRSSSRRRRSGRASTSRESRSRCSSIDKLPFAAPGDPLVEARCERIAQEGGDWFADYAVPAAVLQLRQGFGRLIRGHGDEGVVAILDPRLRTAGLRSALSRGAAACSAGRRTRRRRRLLRRRGAGDCLIPLSSRGQEEEESGPGPAQNEPRSTASVACRRRSGGWNTGTRRPSRTAVSGARRGDHHRRGHRRPRAGDSGQRQRRRRADRTAPARAQTFPPMGRQHVRSSAERLPVQLVPADERAALSARPEGAGRLEHLRPAGARDPLSSTTSSTAASSSSTARTCRNRRCSRSPPGTRPRQPARARRRAASGPRSRRRRLPDASNKIFLTAWTHLVTCTTFDEGAFDKFPDDYRGPDGDAPEKFPLSAATGGQ